MLDSDHNTGISSAQRASSSSAEREEQPVPSQPQPITANQNGMPSSSDAASRSAARKSQRHATQSEPPKKVAKTGDGTNPQSSDGADGGTVPAVSSQAGVELPQSPMVFPAAAGWFANIKSLKGQALRDTATSLGVDATAQPDDIRASLLQLQGQADLVWHGNETPVEIRNLKPAFQSPAAHGPA